MTFNERGRFSDRISRSSCAALAQICPLETHWRHFVSCGMLASEPQIRPRAPLWKRETTSSLSISDAMTTTRTCGAEAEICSSSGTTSAWRPQPWVPTSATCGREPSRMPASSLLLVACPSMQIWPSVAKAERNRSAKMPLILTRTTFTIKLVCDVSGSSKMFMFPR